MAPYTVGLALAPSWTRLAASMCWSTMPQTLMRAFLKTPEQMERQLTTSLIGPINVTRAVLPVIRKQRSGLIITISSTAGLIGFEFDTAYAASKFGLEG